MIGKRILFAIGYCFLLQLVFLHVVAQESYTGESLRKWTQTVENERAPIEIIGNCEPDRGIVPICGIQNPKDIAVLPSEKWLLFSERISNSEPSNSQNSIGSLVVNGCRFGFKSLHWTSDVHLSVPSLDCR